MLLFDRRRMGRSVWPKSTELMSSAFSAQLSCAFGREALSLLSVLSSERSSLVDRRDGLGGDLFLRADLFVLVAQGVSD